MLRVVHHWWVLQIHTIKLSNEERRNIQTDESKNFWFRWCFNVRKINQIALKYTRSSTLINVYAVLFTDNDPSYVDCWSCWSNGPVSCNELFTRIPSSRCKDIIGRIAVLHSEDVSVDDLDEASTFGQQQITHNVSETYARYCYASHG